MKRNQGNKQKNIQSKPLRKIMVMIIAMAFVFTACQKEKKPKPFLLFPLIHNSSVATTYNGSGSGVGSSGNGGSGGNGSGSGGQTSMLDTSFGTSGKVIQPIGSWHDYGYSLAIQTDGKILLGGYCDNGSNYDFCIARFNSNGTLDTSFGTSGKVIQPIGSALDDGQSLAIQSDGKILLGGYCSNGSNLDFCIARFNSNGTLDTSFGSSGKVIQPIGGGGLGYSLAIQSDGKILLGGFCYNGSNDDFCIARFNSNGSLDTSFKSPHGYIIQPIGSSDDRGYSLAIQADGKILLGGYCNLDFCIARFNSNGTLDTSFNSSGKVIQPIGSSSDYGYSLAILSDGKILLGGYCYTSNNDFCIARFQ